MHGSPKIGFWFLKLMIRSSNSDYAIGDNIEIYRSISKRSGRFRGWLWIWTQILTSFPGFLVNSAYWSGVMFKNYLKTSFRNIMKSKTFSFINISGLVLGITCCLLIFLYVQFELSFDSFNEKADRIFRVSEKISTSTGTSRVFAPISGPCGPALEKDYPEILNAVRFLPRSNLEVKYEDRIFYENRWFYTDPDVFDTFTFPFVKGDPGTALLDKSSLVITVDIADKFFGAEDPVGKTMIVNGTGFTITGVIERIPPNSHISFDFLASLNYLEGTSRMSNWFSTMFRTYIEIPENVNPVELEEKIKWIAHNYEGERFKELDQEWIHFMQPLRSIYLHSNLRYDLRSEGSMTNIYMLSVIAVMTLLIACINFTNLSTARSIKRAKEVGIRKIAGAKRIQLIRQFLLESVFMSTLALMISLVVVHISLPYFNELLNKSLSINYTDNVPYILGIIALAAFVGVVSGSYPAFYLTSCKPAAVIRGFKTESGKGGGFRRWLVVIQFGIAIVLIISTITIYKQLEFMKNRELGFEKEQTLILRFKGAHDLPDRYEMLKESFMSHPSIVGAAASYSIPGRGITNFGTQLLEEEDNKDQSMYYFMIEPDFIPLYGMNMVSGRNFSNDIPTDIDESFIINESAVKTFGLSDPEKAIGKRLSSGFGQDGFIIGVVRDFNYESLEQNIDPIVLAIRPRWLRYLSLKINTNNLPETMSFVNEQWKSFYPDKPIEYFFLDDDFNQQYLSDERMGLVFGIFSMQAIAIACLGLFGLSLFTAEQRTKEIGIRKTLGGSVPHIVMLLSRDFTKWIIISNLIAWPAAWFAMNRWLQGFAYRTNLSILFFFGSAAIVFLIALMTVSYQAVRTARKNPVDSLRYE